MSNQISICQVPNTEKFLRDKTYQNVCAKEFALKLYQNETEGVHILITPAVEVKSFNVSVSDLKSENGIIPNEDIEVLVVKYIEVTKCSCETNAELGWYPDALLPMSVSENFKENTISANANQGIFVNVKTRENTVAGKYVGVVKIRLDEYVFEYPLNVTVWDYALPTENHTRQYFIISKKQMLLGEGEKSLERVGNYFEKAFDYRINGSNLPFNHRTETYEEAFENFLVCMKEYYADPRCSFYDICFFLNSTYDDLNYERVDYVYNGIAKECLKDGINYFEKAVTYIWILDEPHLAPERFGYCKKVLPAYAQARKRIAAQYRDMGVFGQKIAESILRVPNIITAGITGELLPDEPDEYTVEWCPAFGYFNFNESNVIWERVKSTQKWWYGCDFPNPPFPTYHIDDKLISPRLLSWMQFNLNITGNLYWRFNFCDASKERGGPNPYVLANPLEHTNGEGFLCYPGKQYGLDAFVSSIRLEAIRDGIEDYEALYSLRAEWQKNAERLNKSYADVNQVMSPVYSRLFDNVRILDKSLIDFSMARETVAKLLIISKKYGFFVQEFHEEQGEIVFYATANVTCNGGTLTKDGEAYVLKAHSEKVELKIGDEDLTLYVQSKKYPVVYNVSFNWRPTAEKYSINADARTIVEPYYSIISNKKERNFKQAIIDLQNLQTFIWRTEIVVLKEKTYDGVKVEFVVPKGSFKINEPYAVRQIDETAKIYTVKTNKKMLSLEAETEKGSYKAVLYL